MKAGVLKSSSEKAFAVSRLDGAVATSTSTPTTSTSTPLSTDYTDAVAEIDKKILAQQKLIAYKNQLLRSFQLELAQIQSDRSNCDFTALEYGVSALIPGSGIIMSADQNKCLDENDKLQQAARTKIAMATSDLKTQVNILNALYTEKANATVDLRAQLQAQAAADELAGKTKIATILAEGQVDPTLIAAKAALEAEQGLIANKKILYAGVVLFIILAGLVGAFMVLSKAKS